MKNINSLDLFVIVAYLVVILGEGCYAGFKRRQECRARSSADRPVRLYATRSQSWIT